MARMDFPNSPTDGQTFTSENVTYTYIASKGYWDSASTLSGIQLSSLSVGTPATADGDGSIAYDNTTGVFTYTPPLRQASQFYILQTGAFTGPITGTVEFTPTSTITITSVEASIANIEAANVVFAVLKNGTLLQEFSILAGTVELASAFTNNTITSSDIITLNIVSGAGQDLVLRFIY